MRGIIRARSLPRKFCWTAREPGLGTQAEANVIDFDAALVHTVTPVTWTCGITILMKDPFEG